MTGGAGAGKTHIACALCITALHQMRTVKYIRANYLLQEAEHARLKNAYYEYTNEMSMYDLLVIDDFGMMDLNMDKCRDLFEVIESRDFLRHETGQVILNVIVILCDVMNPYLRLLHRRNTGCRCSQCFA